MLKRIQNRIGLVPSRVEGFTLIELLVVIAIIGILASIVLASLNTARNKGADAAIKGNLSNIRVQAELYYDNQNPNTYAATAYPKGTCPAAASTGNIFADPTLFQAIASATTIAGGVANTQCYASATKWAAAVQLKTGGTAADAIPDSWCVDNTGQGKSYTYAAAETIAAAINVDVCK